MIHTNHGMVSINDNQKAFQFTYILHIATNTSRINHIKYANMAIPANIPAPIDVHFANFFVTESDFLIVHFIMFVICNNPSLYNYTTA